MKGALVSILFLAGTLFAAVYALCMFRAILATPEPGWEFALAWEYTMEVFGHYWTGLKLEIAVIGAALLYTFYPLIEKD